MGRPNVSRGWLAAAIIVSASVILGAPYIGQLRTAVREYVGGDDNFTRVMIGVVGGVMSLAIVGALIRIRDRRQLRYGALAAALVIGVAYSLAARTGNPAVDAVERFHFVEYGLITFLFYRAWRPSADGSLFVMPLLMGLAVGTLEEWLQWFIPARVGEARDVLLNFFAIGCGLLFSLGVDPPPVSSLRLSPATKRQAACVTAAVVVLFGMFVHSVHLGYEIKDPEAGVFRSRYSDDELPTIASERARSWHANPPLTWSRLSREDQYFSEGVAHVRRRNEAWQEGNVLAARHENLILEKYYAPVLDTPSYVSATGFRWPPEQRATAESQRGPGFMIYVSDGNDYPIIVWSKWVFWLGIAVMVIAVLRAIPSRA